MMRAFPILLPAVAAGLLVVRRSLPAPAAGPEHARLTRVSAACLALSAIAAAIMLVDHGRVLLPDATPLEGASAAVTTWIGQVIAGQGALAVLALASLVSPAALGLAIALAVLAAATGALRGHPIAAEAGAPIALAAFAHVTLASLWIGGLAALVARRLADGRRGPAGSVGWEAGLRGFSPWALRGMAVLLVTGVLLADRTVSAGAALVATPYGLGLLAKLCAVGGALWCAGRLRAWLARPACGAPGRAGLWLGLEAGLAVAAVLAAGRMAGMIPAAHDIIDWPFSFRVAPTAAWLQKGADAARPAAAGLVVASVSMLAAWRLRHRGARRAAAIAIAGVLAGGAMALPALSVDAYPTTYLHSPVPYDAVAVSAGARLFRRWCTDCHGAQGRGDGPLAASLPVPPANLTEPHVQWHTHGDLYWWLTAGIPRSGMPGFRDRLSDDQRWQVLNYLAALSLGHEARPVSATIAPRDPWLPAMDIRYVDGAGEFASLAEWRRRERPVLLAFAEDDAQSRRLGALAGVAGRAGVEAVLVVARDSATGAAPAGWERVVDTSGDLRAAWSLYRRTLEDPDFADERAATGGLIFLIDRFGFVRARWTAAAALPGIDEVAALVTRLAREPRLRNADLHAAR